LISYLQKEGADRIVQDALYGSGRLFKHIELYASRQREYQAKGQCPTDSGAYNRHAVAEELSDALFRAYDALQNDHVLDTGLRAVEITEARPLLTRLLEVSQALFRSVHPYKGVLKTVLVELSGGGKCNWVARMERSADDRLPVEGGVALAEAMFSEMAHLQVEQVRVAFLDAGRRLIRIEVMGVGTILFLGLRFFFNQRQLAMDKLDRFAAVVAHE
jgi:hypothetical protein